MPLKLISSEPIHQSRIFSLVRDTVVLPSGRETERDVVIHPGAVAIIPVDKDGRLILVRQYRHAPRKTLLEFPAGTLERGEAPLECAKRELIEETGFEALEWTELGIQYPAPGFCNEIQYLYLAKNLNAKPMNLDDDEIIEVEKHSVKGFEEMVAGGLIEDGKSMAIFLRARCIGLL